MGFSEYYILNLSHFDDYNDTYDTYEPLEICHSENKGITPYLHAIICILGFVGNILAICTYAFYKKTKSMTAIYLLNVAIADLLFVVSLPFIIYNDVLSWPMGPAVCKLLGGFYSLNLYCGMLLLACISIDCYISIVQARRSRQRSLLCRFLMCAIIWIAAILLSIPTLYFYNWYSLFEYSFEEDVLTSRPQEYACQLNVMDVHTGPKTKVSVSIIQLAAGFFLPLLIMVLCLTGVIVTLLKARNFQQHKMVQVVLAVAAVFILCHLPYNITQLYITVNMSEINSCEQSIALETSETVTKTIAYLHCCLNPILYAFFWVKFREPLQQDFPRPWVYTMPLIQEDQGQ